MHRDALVRQVKQFLHRQGLDSAGLVVAVSGGPDSVALLGALAALRASAGGPRLLIAHLNHQLRGQESDADETFVRQLHAVFLSAGVTPMELRCERIDVGARARTEADNIEKVARNMRYGWLADVARQAGLGFVATAHTADDQAETVLHRLLRGTGLQGLRGIAARRALTEDVQVVRPLLTVRREEVLAYLRRERQPYCHDCTNFDLRRTRNRIRHELLPHLAERYNPGVVVALCRLAEQAAEMHREQEGRAAVLLGQAERPRAGSVLVLDRACLAVAPRHLVREVFRLAWTREGWPLARMGFDDWDRLAGLVYGDCPAIDLPGGVQARCRSRVIQIGRHWSEDSPPSRSGR